MKTQKQLTIEFVIWLQDNYTTMKYKGQPEPLFEGYYRLKGTETIQKIDDIYDEWFKKY